MDWKTRAAACLALLLAVPALAQELPAADDEVVIFGFHPTDGATWRKTALDREVRDLGTLAPRYEMVTEQELLISYHKLENGWRVTQVAESAAMTQNGQKIDNPALNQAIGLEVNLDVNTLGAAVSASGFEEFIDRLEKVLDPQSYARYRQANSAESVAANEVWIWNTFYSELLGYEVRPGEVWRVMDGVNVGTGGRARVLGTITFDGWTEIGGERGFKVTYRYDTTGEIMAAAEETHSRSITRVEGEEFTQNNAVVEGTWVRVIQPSTGQLLYSVKDQTMVLPLSAEDLSQTGTFERHHTYRWSRVDS